MSCAAAEHASCADGEAPRRAPSPVGSVGTPSRLARPRSRAAASLRSRRRRRGLVRARRRDLRAGGLPRRGSPRGGALGAGRRAAPRARDRRVRARASRSRRSAAVGDPRRGAARRRRAPAAPGRNRRRHSRAGAPRGCESPRRSGAHLRHLRETRSARGGGGARGGLSADVVRARPSRQAARRHGRPRPLADGHRAARLVRERHLQAVRSRDRSRNRVDERRCPPVPRACNRRVRTGALHDRERLAADDPRGDDGAVVRRRVRGADRRRPARSAVRNCLRLLRSRAVTELALTELSLGCAQLGNLYRSVTDDEAAATVDAAWNAGIRYFDTAPHYGLGLSERRLGGALAGRARSEYVVSTKVGRRLVPLPEPYGRDDDGFDVPATHRRVWDFSRDGVLRSLEESLERLGLDRVDVVFLHDPDDHWAEALNEAYPALEELRAQGAV
ncbi:MAG: aldo/keto reductase, partial [Actinobacteria bacterium]|nr:aldo/keto reductase [Actinomycetota bacterium]